MTVSVETEVEIRRLFFAEHWRVGTIAAQLGVHEDVVRRVTGLTERKPPSTPRSRLVDPVADFISDTLERYPRLRATRLYDMVRDRNRSAPRHGWGITEKKKFQKFHSEGSPTHPFL